MFRNLALSLAIATVFGFATIAPAQAQGWDRIGSRVVAHQAERDVISGRGDGRFSRIRICVERRAVRFYDVDVVFGNGGRQDIRLRRRIGPGDCTRAIDLRGGRRFIRRIIFDYETIRDRGPRAIVTVFGRR